MFGARILRAGMVGATGGAALYYSVATRRSAPLQPQAPSEKPTLLDLPIVRLIAPRAAQCEGGDNTLLYGLAAAVAAGGLAYVKFGQGSGEFDYASTPMVEPSSVENFPDFNIAQKAQAQGDLRTAFDHYKKAAEAGCVLAMTAVGAFYEDENLTFIQKDTEQAFKWFTKAAKHGEVDAMVRLGMMHDMGVPPAEIDAVKANKLFAVAADRGDPDAMFYLAWGYYKGEGGLEKDPAKGRELLLAAQARGHQRAQAVLQDLDATAAQ